MKIGSLIFCFALGSGCASCKDYHSQNAIEPVSLEEFYDVIKHWRDQHPDAHELLLDENDVSGIAHNLLLYQRDNGGWPENKNLLLKLSPQEKATLLSEKTRLDSSLDNRNTWPQIRYLAYAYQRTLNPAFQEAVLKGLDYLLQNQYENGGWAHSPPATGGYRSQITITDEVMSGVLTLLRDIATQEPPFEFLDDQLVTRVYMAWRKGEELLLDLQVQINGELTIWAGQYDRLTLAPVGARAFELSGLVSSESVDVVRYFMAEKNPDKRITMAVDSAIAWFEKNKITGLRIEKFAIEPVRHDYHTSTYDLRVVYDENAPPVWARFYDFETQEPFMANRDGVKVYKLEEVKLERRTGYAWYGDWPQQLLEIEYPSWKNRHSKK